MYVNHSTLEKVLGTCSEENCVREGNCKCMVFPALFKTLGIVWAANNDACPENEIIAKSNIYGEAYN